MTTREATPLLTRSTELDASRSLGDWMWQLGIGAVQWPFLLKSLYGGRKADKAALLDRLRLPHDALPNLGSWKADVGMLNRVADLISAHKPEIVVELGSGASSLVVLKSLELAGGGRLFSYDQHADFVEETRKWVASHGLSGEFRHAPLVSQSGDRRDLWYALEAVPDKIDLLVIDGPPWTVHPLVRRHAARLFDRVAPGGIILLDDAARPGERIIARDWRKAFPKVDWRFEPSIKGRLIGKRRSE